MSGLFYFIYLLYRMNILPKKRNVMLTLKQEAPAGDEGVVEESPQEEEVEEVEESEEESEEALEAPTNDLVFERPPEAPPGNVIEADLSVEPKKKKRQLSEKQLAHLARMRKLALAKRKKLKEQKEAEKAKKRAIREEKRKAKELLEAQRAERRKAREARKKQHAMETKDMGTPPSKGDMEFIKFFKHMERYDRIKQVRKRQNNRTYTSNTPQQHKQSRSTKQAPKPTLQQQTPSNPYLGSLIPF